MSINSTLKSIRDIMRNDQGLSGDAQRLEQLGWMIFYKIFCGKELESQLFNRLYISPIPKELVWSAWASNDEGMTGEQLIEFVDRRLFPILKNLSVEDNKRAEIVRDVFFWQQQLHEIRNLSKTSDQ